MLPKKIQKSTLKSRIFLQFLQTKNGLMCSVGMQGFRLGAIVAYNGPR